MNTANQVNIVDEIKSRCNIVDVIGRVVPLKKAGSNYKGICPFHNEKTPSFVVSDAKQIYTCFGCGATGDLINFVERYYNLEFKGAVELLAKEYGVSLEGAFKSSGNKDELYEINRQAARFFFRAMREKANPGYTYMRNRGISDEILNKFGVGYADDRWNSLMDHLTAQGISRDKLLELGLVSKSKDRYFDKFRSRVIFPIQNTGGKVIGFGGRIVGEGEPKYLNSQESSVFQKKSNLYGLNLTRTDVSKEDCLVLVEGYMDVVSLYQSGVRNVSASLGTALTENQARLVKRYTRNVILSYDADQAGQNAALRGLDILYREDCRAKVLKVTDGKDPDEFVKKKGKGAFLKLMEEALPYGDFKLDVLRAKYRLEEEQERIEFMREAVGVLQAMKPVEADIYIKKLADETGISEGAIRFEYSGNNSQEKNIPAYDKRSETKEPPDRQMSLVEQDLIKLMMTDEAFTRLPEDVAPEAFQSDTGKQLYQAILKVDKGLRPLDFGPMQDLLDEDGVAALERIREKIIPQGKEKSVFEDCIARIQEDSLKRQQTEILTRLSMADEEENREDIVKLTQQLIEIQKRLKK